jgi:excisionase family DNA binding protein
LLDRYYLLGYEKRGTFDQPLKKGGFMGTQKHALSVEEAASYSGYTRAWLYSLLAQGKVSSPKSRPKQRISKASLDRYLRSLGRIPKARER